MLLAWGLYAFNLFALGPVLVLFFVNLMIMGWWVALGVVSLILRHGAGAEALAWSVLFGLTPFSAVFYPVSVLPAACSRSPGAAVGACVRGHARRAAARRDALGPHGLRVRAEPLWLAAPSLCSRGHFRQARVRGALAEHRGMMEHTVSG